eukprot:3161395-Prymnesium_polylepis.1
MPDPNRIVARDTIRAFAKCGVALRCSPTTSTPPEPDTVTGHPCTCLVDIRRSPGSARHGMGLLGW